MITDNVSITGDLYITLHNEDGELKDSRTINNMVVTSGKDLIAALIAGSTVKPTHIGLGTDNTPAAAAQTELGVETGTRFTFNTATSSANVATFTATLMPGTGTGNYTEAGIFTASTAGVMLARTTFNTITKTSVDKLVITWNIRVN